MLGGIILCGGKSRRMGRSKAWLPFGPEVLLQRVVRILGEVARPIVVVAATGQVLPGLPDHVVIVRDPVADLGPIQGLVAGLKALPTDVELVYLSATDAPFLHSKWVTRLSELIGQADLAIPEVGGQLHPLSSLYRRQTILPAAEGLLAEGRFRMLDLVGRVRSIRVDTSELVDVDSGLETLRNLNTPEEYEQALKDLARFSKAQPEK